MNKNFLNKSILIAATLWSGQLIAGSVTVPNTFVGGSTASASEVNANFGAIKTAVDDNDGRITINASDIRANSANITANTNAISAIGGVGVFVNGVRVGSLLGMPGSGSPDFHVLLSTNYITRVRLDGTGISNNLPLETLFTSDTCDGQAYALGEMSGFPVVDAFVPSGQGQLYATIGDDPVLYRYIPTGTPSEPLSYNSKYSGGVCFVESATVTAYKTFPNDSNITGVTSAEFIGSLTIGH